MKKILILSNEHAYTYDLRKEVIAALLSKYVVYVAVPYGEKVELLKDMGCKYIDVELEKRGKNPFQDLKLLHAYGRMMAEIKPDLVLTYTIKPNVYGGMAAAKKNIPYIANITGLGTAIETPGLLQKITIMLHKIAFRKISCVFFQNEENMQFFKQKKICHGKYELLPGSGVNTKEYAYLQYPNDKNAINFLFISRIMKEKGIEEYIEAASETHVKYPQTRFHILGSCNDEYKDMIAKADRDKIVIYHGRTNDVSSFIEESHCLIHPSYYPEGMSNVCLEAASCGRPVITTKRSGCRETVEDGVTGFLIEKKNVEELIAAIDKFVQLPLEEKRQMGLYARHKMEIQFERQKVVDAYNKQIERVL